ncbi:TfuA-like protein [Methanobrevibacter ruminantium M1]|uniref:TfuA-like protein n=1 Tax=Methanobrevibacter ruminantium (strain ATCC 35063 / DSM 1093 / JCM 13430 / OCM 146 / M1) TaxID=634498 RepID=D3E1V7_METRM|nr:TfuA-related McrA-glycine thioamidation protein [Methanobrevibacter ruminantium]ADC46518.1 TfuA-like protein [Methanobrevibacter ruminantium M1]
MTKIIVYLGLSIQEEEAKTILDADYRTPVKRGDILKAISEKPDIIGIIDGVFHHTPAVAHKEIMKALKMGITVVGASSMGALRASELDDLGMIGIGYVYKAYRSGKITSDDDVALSFDPERNVPISEALVNIDYKLDLAVKEEIISEEDKEYIHNIAKDIYYPKRSYQYIFSKVEMEDEKKTKLIDFILKEKDIKYLDAIEALEYIKSISEEE